MKMRWLCCTKMGSWRQRGRETEKWCQNPALQQKTTDDDDDDDEYMLLSYVTYKCISMLLTLTPLGTPKLHSNTVI